MNKAVTDIGEKERAAGCTFFALTRLKTLSGVLIQPMPFDQLTAIEKLKRLQQRITEEQRLKHLAMSD